MLFACDGGLHGSLARTELLVRSREPLISFHARSEEMLGELAENRVITLSERRVQDDGGIMVRHDLIDAYAVSKSAPLFTLSAST